MTEKIMKVFYDTNGLPYKDKARQVHYPLVGSAFMGASNTTQIRFYVSLLGNSNDTWVSCAKLPNGQLGYKMLSATYDSEEEEYYVSLSLTTFYTQYKGDVYIALQGYQSGVSIQETSVGSGIYKVVGTPTIQATGVIKLAMNYTPQISPSALSEDITAEDIQEFLSAISTGIGGVIPKISSSNIASYDFDINLFHNNEIIFNDYDNSFYQLKVVNSNLKAYKVAELKLRGDMSGAIKLNTLQVGTIVSTGDAPNAYISVANYSIEIAGDQGNSLVEVSGDGISLNTPNHEIGIDVQEGAAKVVSKDQYGYETGLRIDDDRSVNLVYEPYDLQSGSHIILDSDIYIGSEGGDVSIDGTRVTKNGNEITNGYTCVGTISTSGGETNSTDRPHLRVYPTFLFANVRVDIAPYYNISRVIFRQQEIGSRIYYSEIFKYVSTSAGGKYMQFKIEFASNFNSYSATILFNDELTNKAYIDSVVSGTYQIKGGQTVSYLNNTFTKSSDKNGYVYNITTGGDLTNQDSSTISVIAGDNVVFIWNGGAWYWDKLAGTIDTSNFVLKSTTIAGNNLSANISSETLTDSLVFATNNDIDNLFE